MTMRTRTDYVCECGHKGHSILSENDQPYSKSWEQEDYYGIAELDRQPGERRQLKCLGCGEIGKVRQA